MFEEGDILLFYRLNVTNSLTFRFTMKTIKVLYLTKKSPSIHISTVKANKFEWNFLLIPNTALFIAVKALLKYKDKIQN